MIQAKSSTKKDKLTLALVLCRYLVGIGLYGRKFVIYKVV